MCRKPNRLHERSIGYKKGHDPTGQSDEKSGGNKFCVAKPIFTEKCDSSKSQNDIFFLHKHKY